MVLGTFFVENEKIIRSIPITSEKNEPRNCCLEIPRKHPRSPQQLTSPAIIQGMGY